MTHRSPTQRHSPTRMGGAAKLALVLLIAAVAALWIAWEAGLQNRFTPRNFAPVQEGAIYRSGRLSPDMTRRVVQEHNIKTIIDLGAYDPGSAEERSARAVADDLDVIRVRLNLAGDGTGNPNDYVAALRIMSNPDAQPVLVHCAAGVNRTGSCIMLHRHIHENADFRVSFNEAIDHGADPGDNWRQLAYLADYADDITRAFRNGTWVPDRDPPAIDPSVAARFALDLSPAPSEPGADDTPADQDTGADINADPAPDVRTDG